MWKKCEPGWWHNHVLKIGVCKERDNRWHSYATDNDGYYTSPSFKTMKEAMRDAERRVKEDSDATSSSLPPEEPPQSP